MITNLPTTSFGGLYRGLFISDYTHIYTAELSKWQKVIQWHAWHLLAFESYPTHVHIETDHSHTSRCYSIILHHADNHTQTRRTEREKQALHYLKKNLCCSRNSIEYYIEDNHTQTGNKKIMDQDI